MKTRWFCDIGSSVDGATEWIPTNVSSVAFTRGTVYQKDFLSLVSTQFDDIHLNIDIGSKHSKHFEIHKDWTASQWRCLKLLLIIKFRPVLFNFVGFFMATPDLFRVYKLNKKSLTYSVISRRKWTPKWLIHRYHLPLVYTYYILNI